jgi:hypothetical protein
MSSSARWRLFGSRSSGTETDELRKQVTALQAALQQCRTVVRRTKELTLTLTGAVAVSLVLGFVLGVYNEPIGDSISGLLLRARGVEVLTPHCSAASGIVAPASIVLTTRVRKSSEYGSAIHAGLLQQEA